MTLSLNIALNNSFSSEHDLNDELDIATLMTHRISACATDTELITEFKVGDDVLLLLRLSDNASVLLLLKYKLDVDSLAFPLYLRFLALIWLSRLDFPRSPTSNSFIQSLHFALNGCLGTFEIHDLYFCICNHLYWKDIFDVLFIFILLKQNSMKSSVMFV